VVGVPEVIQILAFEGAFCEMWPARRVRARDHVLLPVNTSSQHGLVDRRNRTRTVIVSVSGSVFSSLAYHEYREENRCKAEGDIDDFVTREVRGMFHLRGRNWKDSRSTDCTSFSWGFKETGQWAGMLRSERDDRNRSRKLRAYIDAIKYSQ
jgi:hypothetical protein